MSDGRRAMAGVLLLCVAYVISVSVRGNGISSRNSSSPAAKAFPVAGGPPAPALEEKRRRVAELRAENEKLKAEQAGILNALKLQKASATQSTGSSSSSSSTTSTTNLRAFRPAPVQPAVAQPVPPARQAPVPGLHSQASSVFSGGAPASTASAANGGAGGGQLQPGQVVSFSSKQAGCNFAMDSNSWLSCTSDSSTPLQHRAFSVEDAGDGWVTLKSMAHDAALEMVPRTQPLAWVVRLASTSSSTNLRQHWRFQSGGLFNRENQAFVNVIVDAGNVVRGHGNTPNKNRAAGPEPSTSVLIRSHSAGEFEEDRRAVQHKLNAEAQEEQEVIQRIHALPRSTEKRVISYGLYGSNPKYVTGAIRNAELVPVYFPGWTARFYVDNTVPKHILDTLRAKGAEIVNVPDIKGNIAGMFWRFLVADDPTVDRYIVRDSDSRLNPRERLAVEEWIQSGKGIHTIRDHPNHDRPMNGGLWGGTKGAIKDITSMIRRFKDKQRYGGDLVFLTKMIWPMVKNNQIAHDAYTCSKYPNSHPFPTRRPANYQHVGQVFFENDKARMGDIDNFIRGRDTPMACRKHPEWKYG